MNENKIQCALFLDLQASHKLVMPNFSPPNWWENDILAVTNSDYWVEHEIKVSVADFKKDATKVKDERGINNWRTGRTINKHEVIASKDGRGPSRFYFVVVTGMENNITVPEWAGLKIAHPYKNRVVVTTHKKAPQLHKNKIDPKIIDGARAACYWRMWSYKKNNA